HVVDQVGAGDGVLDTGRDDVGAPCGGEHVEQGLVGEERLIIPAVGCPLTDGGGRWPGRFGEGTLQVEGRVSIDQWQTDADNGTLTEVFACGTAATITPVGTVKRASTEWLQSGGEPGKVTLRLPEALLDIQRSITEDTHG
ncbi:hypothetical protein ACWCPD_41100, partial [Streptomyces sp. NPDC001935]